MGLIAFIITVILVSLSGVLMPGPIFATAIAEGRKNKHAGFLIAIGHAIVEMPIMATLFFFGGMKIDERIKALIGLTGGLFLIYFAISSLKEKEEKLIKGLLAGIILSSFNPYFIMWWLTIGFTLAIKANAFGKAGFIILVIFHEMCDFLWYEFLSFSSNYGIRFKKVEKALKIVSFSLLLLFGIYFIYDSIKIIT